MNEAERKALSALRFNSAPTADDVWRASPYHVEELHREAVERVFEGVDSARSDRAGSSPLGVVIQGPSGAGKTHLLGMVRERIQRDGGYFFLVSLLNGKAFWESAALSVVDGLLQPGADGRTQLAVFFDRLASLLGLPAEVRDAVVGTGTSAGAELTLETLDRFVLALRRYDRALGQEAQDTVRALVLHGSADPKAQVVGYTYLNSLDAGDTPGDRAFWGMGREGRPAQLLVRDLSRLLALTGPTVIAIDQIDTLFAQSAGSVLQADSALDPRASVLLGQVADGLMALRETARRTLTVVACLPDTWAIIKRDAATPVPDRFRETYTIGRIPSAGIGRSIVSRRFGASFGEVGFTPPYPTWPIAEAAFADAPQFTPRALIRKVEWHVRECLRSGVVVELERLAGPVPELGRPGPAVEVPLADSTSLADLDARFAWLVGAASIDAAFDPAHEDRALPRLLAAGLTAWITEATGDGRSYKLDPAPGTRPGLHARLRRILDESTEDEAHWALRGIASGNANAVISRIRSACTLAAPDIDVPARKLILLRNGEWPHGPKTAEVIAAFQAAGGEVWPLVAADLKVFAALGELLAEGREDLRAWLIARRPAGSTELLRRLLGAESASPAAPAQSPEPPEAVVSVSPATPLTSVAPLAPVVPVAPLMPVVPVVPVEPTVLAGPTTPLPSIPLGVATQDGARFSVGLEALRKHTAIFAGSGSGKTVLIRRLVEECALQGVSAVVLDPNNDLGRLGDPWPEPPGGWAPGDQAKADEYLANTDVVVWTPRITAGRPLSFQPLPNFDAVRDDPDEFRAAVDVAVGALAPRAKVDGNTAKAQLGQAVLRDALSFHALYGKGGGLRSFIDLLGALPEGVTSLAAGEKTAAELAERLTAAMVNDPLFGGDGTPVDPAVLLTPPSGKRARVSVISFIGLHSDEQRQGFVNQLQMALFAWIKRNPAGERPLGGLFVMDEAQTFAPSVGKTACTESTLALVSQARKYGLGLVFATQAPKGLHNHIPGNAATQFFGLLNSPIQIAAAKEMAQAKGGSVPDIGVLTTGQFYAAREGFAFQKIQAPLCLTHHPRAPLTPEELVERAAPGRGRRRKEC